MKYEISEKEITMLEVLENKILLSSLGQMFKIKSFFIVEETERGIFGGKHKVKYLTELNMLTYSPVGKFLGTVRENSCQSMLIRYDFYVMRQQWLDFVEQLKSFGFKLVNIDDQPTENKQ